ncbi:MAG: hypothetical protein M3Z66_22265 [Chloroflexota bacterium]|nr:hypothetical protein [Chloroflexota bacterium]
MTPQLLAAAMVMSSAVDVRTRAEPSPSAQTNACPAPGGRTEVKTRVGPLAVSTDLTFEQIAALAQRHGQLLRHPPYGFYLGRIRYQFAIHEGPDTPQGCAPEFHVIADMALIDRHIEIASDLKRDACLFQIALQHYRSHAEADQHAFDEFAATVPARIQAALAGMIETPLRKDTFGRTWASAFDKVMPILDRAREDAKTAVDSSSEVDRLTHPACSA